MSVSSPVQTSKSWGVLALFLVVVLGGGMLIGVNNPPGDWYAGLQKPWFTPPGILFAKDGEWKVKPTSEYVGTIWRR